VACPACGQSDVGQYGEYPCRTCGLPKEWGNDPLSTQPETSATASEQPERIGDLLAVLLRTSERIGASKDHAEVLKLRQQRREAYHQIAQACGVVIFDGPDAFAEVDAAQHRLDDEIAAAGGLEAWRATASVAGLMDEESATEDLISALAQCRDAFPTPESGSPLESQWMAAIACPSEVPEYVRQCVAGLSAAAPAVEGRLMVLAEAYAKAFAAGGRDAAHSHRNRLRVELVAALTTHREHPAAQQERQEVGHADIAQAIHYPDCWDQDAYPTLASALNELVSAFQCTNKDTHLLAAQAQKEKP
jgi:hypothetical protein